MLKGDFDKALIDFNAVPVGTLRCKEAVTKRLRRRQSCSQYQAAHAGLPSCPRTCQVKLAPTWRTHSKAMVSLLAKAESRLRPARL